MYHNQMGKDYNLVERQTFSSEFHLPKQRSNIIRVWEPSVSLSLSLSLSLFLEGSNPSFAPLCICHCYQRRVYRCLLSICLYKINHIPTVARKPDIYSAEISHLNSAKLIPQEKMRLVKNFSICRNNLGPFFYIGNSKQFLPYPLLSNKMYLFLIPMAI